MREMSDWEKFLFEDISVPADTKKESDALQEDRNAERRMAKSRSREVVGGYDAVDLMEAYHYSHKEFALVLTHARQVLKQRLQTLDSIERERRPLPTDLKLNPEDVDGPGSVRNEVEHIRNLNRLMTRFNDVRGDGLLSDEHDHRQFVDIPNLFYQGPYSATNNSSAEDDLFRILMSRQRDFR